MIIIIVIIKYQEKNYEDMARESGNQNGLLLMVIRTPGTLPNGLEKLIKLGTVSVEFFQKAGLGFCHGKKYFGQDSGKNR